MELNLNFNNEKDLLAAAEILSDFYFETMGLTLTFPVADEMDADNTEKAISQELDTAGLDYKNFILE